MVREKDTRKLDCDEERRERVNKIPDSTMKLIAVLGAIGMSDSLMLANTPSPGRYPSKPKIAIAIAHIE
jgi:hypothetical protein